MIRIKYFINETLIKFKILNKDFSLKNIAERKCEIFK